MRQGNDVGTQYRSAIYWQTDAQRETADALRAMYQQALAAAGHRATITTEIAEAGPFYYAESYHQQYLARTRTATAGLAARVSRAPSASVSRRTPDVGASGYVAAPPCLVFTGRSGVIPLAPASLCAK